MPAVATSDAARGLEVVPDEHLLIADDTPDIVDALVRILSDDATWRGLSERGRDLVRARYVPEIAFRGLDAAVAEASLLKP